MNDPKAAPKYESIALRILWMLVFALVWQWRSSCSARWWWCS